MAGSLNRATIMGRVGRDPEIKSFQNGGRICTFSVATSETWKDKQTGEKKERTQWHNVTISADGLIGVCERYVRKGSMVYIEGQLETRKWQDQSGSDRYTTEIVIRPYVGQLILAGGGNGGEERGSGRGDSGGYGNGGGSSYGGGGGGQQGNAGGRSNGGWQDDLDDDVPF